MKKLFLYAVPAVVVVIVSIWGKDLMGLYRLQAYVTESGEHYQETKGEWPHTVDACLACHGTGGTSLHQGYPSLAGQPASYIVDQLKKFASGERSNPNMGPLAKSMDAAEMQVYADYFARQPVRANQYFEPDPEGKALGQKLVTDGNCAACHGERLLGKNLYPRLAGQTHDYLLAQLHGFASGSRKDTTTVMNNLMGAYSEEERKAIAAHLSSLDPTAP